MDSCAKCGKSIRWFKVEWMRKDFSPEFYSKILCNSCNNELLNKIANQGNTVNYLKINALLKKCCDCGYFEETKHDIGGYDNEIYIDRSYSTFRCRKFSFNVDKNTVIADKCSSYISIYEYQQKALKGELEKENVQIILDFSSLKDVMSKGGLVMTTYKCPNCGGMVNIPEAGKVLVCQYCGSR